MLLFSLLMLGCGAGVVEWEDDDDDGDTAEVSPEESPLCINEWMPDNGGVYVVDGESPDWIELYHTGFETLSLEGWSLALDDGDPIDLSPIGDVRSTDTLMLYAEGEDAVEQRHLPFEFGDSGGVLTLMGPDGYGERVRFGAVYSNYAVARSVDCCLSSSCLEHVYGGSPDRENQSSR